jgi:hypothetical protein
MRQEAAVANVDLKLEIVVIPVSDVDRAKEFYAQLGKGVAIGEVFHDSAGEYAGPDEPYLFGRLRVSGLAAERASYHSFASFHDPDGNGWLLQEITTREPGRVETETTFASVADLAAALRRAGAALGKHEERNGGQYDENWAEWYAEYIVREQSGEELPL